MSDESLLIHSPLETVFENLALEEILLKEFDQNFLLLYINNPCVVVGKHQNTLAEVNHLYLSKNQIPVARRLSGGGTVYHDEGNINFSFIHNTSGNNQVDFRKYAAPILSFLQQTGIKAEFDQRNNLVVDGKKISGNAEHVYKKRVLHHGTLLFNSNLEDLRLALSSKKDLYIGRRVDSVGAVTTNIEEHQPLKQGLDEFIEQLKQYFQDKHEYKLMFAEQRLLGKINTLVNQKYKSFDWKYGWSPDYDFVNRVIVKDIELQITFKVSKGIIIHSDLSSTPNNQIIKLLNKQTVNQPHHYTALESILKLSANKMELNLEQTDEFISNFF